MFYASVNFCPVPSLQERESEIGLVEMCGAVCLMGLGRGKSGRLST
jgi:hypothetical protein